MENDLTSREGLRYAFMSRYDIPDRENPDVTYLTRWRLIQTPWFGVYLHKILLHDSDIHEHNHPWNFYVLILKGWYVESVEGKLIERRKFSFRHMPRNLYHMVKALGDNKPVWTLCFVGRRSQDWGFMVEGTHIPYKEYFGGKA